MTQSTFDPLENITQDLLQSAVKQRIRNIIRSYHNATDVIAEPIQNAMDAIVQANLENLPGSGNVRIKINAMANEIEITDDGPGVSLENIKKFLAPDVTGKKPLFEQGKVRGHKGVGLTFLAYGFNDFEFESRTTSGEHYRVRLSGGRSWVESNQGLRPQAEVLHSPPNSRVAIRGTSLKIRVGPPSQPKEIGKAFNNFELTAAVLESQTAIGIVPPWHESHPQVTAVLEYTDSGNLMHTITLQTRYRYPHTEIPVGIHVIDLNAYKRSNPDSIEPDAKHKKKYHAAFEIYSCERMKDFVTQGGEVLTDMEEVKKYMDAHLLNVYALFSYSTAFRDKLRDHWKIAGNKKFHEAGVRIASDGMISSWRRDVNLSYAGGNKERLWIVYHFQKVEPDMGRKEFPPEIHDVIRLTEERISSAIIKDSLPFLKPAPKKRDYRDNEDDSIAPAVKAHIRLRELSMKPAEIEGLGEIPLLSIPQEELDVIALFNQLCAMKLLACYRPVYFSGIDDYDCYVEYRPKEVSPILNNFFPGDAVVQKKEMSGVLEFKLHAEAILDDLLNGTKLWEEMRFLVCWDILEQSKNRGGDAIQFSETTSYVDRKYAGVTHLAYLQSHGTHPLFVISLKHVLEVIQQMHTSFDLNP